VGSQAPPSSKQNTSEFVTTKRNETTKQRNNENTNPGGAPAAPLDDSTERERSRKEAKKQWRNGLPRQELTKEMEKELKILQMRKFADPKRFYRSNDSDKLPTHFHVGVEVGGGLSGRRIGADTAVVDSTSAKRRRRRGKSYVSELLRDEELGSWTRRKYAEVGAYGQSASLSGAPAAPGAAGLIGQAKKTTKGKAGKAKGTGQGGGGGKKGGPKKLGGRKNTGWNQSKKPKNKAKKR